MSIHTLRHVATHKHQLWLILWLLYIYKRFPSLSKTYWYPQKFRYKLQYLKDIYKAFWVQVLLTQIIFMKKGTTEQPKTSSLADFTPLVSFYTP